MWEEAKPLNSKKIRKIAALALAFLLLLYVGYQGYMATHQSLKTETAMYGQVSDVLQVDGFVIRNETVVEDSYNGVLSYRVGDGTRVSTGGVIADIFASESDAAAYGEVERLNREIENLQALSQPADFFVANPTMLSDQIYAAVDQISVAINQNNFSDLTTLKEELQTALSRRQLITGEEFSGKSAGRPTGAGGQHHRHHYSPCRRVFHKLCGWFGNGCGCGPGGGPDRIPGGRSFAAGGNRTERRRG